MAKKTAGRRSAPTPARKRRRTLRRPLNVTAAMRKLFPWIESAAGGAMAQALAKRKEKWKEGTAPLSEERRRELADEINALQKKINPDLERIDEIAEQLKIDWAHTGRYEIEGSEGNALIALSYVLQMESRKAVRKLKKGERRKFTAAVLQLERFFAAANDSERLQGIAAETIGVSELRVTLTPAASRRPRSAGAPGESEAPLVPEQTSEERVE